MRTLFFYILLITSSNLYAESMICVVDAAAIVSDGDDTERVNLICTSSLKVKLHFA